MNTSRWRASRVKRAVRGCHACGLVIAWCMTQAMLSPSAAAQAPAASRDELMRKWDIDRDGKVDASEAEIARDRMRRARADTMRNSATDPVTGKPREATGTVTGRPVPPDASAADRGGLPDSAADDGLILVPGHGERPGAAGGMAAGTDMPTRPLQRDRESLPGTRSPAMPSTIPSVTPRLSNGMPAPDANSRSPRAAAAAGRQGPPGPRDAGGGELSSRARVLPGAYPGASPRITPGMASGMASGQNPNARAPQSLNAGQDRQQPGARPGIIAGGVRAGAPSVRLGYGAGGVPRDLNAGRPTVQPPSVPRPGIGPYRGPTPPGGPAVGAPSATRTPSTVPRAPRMTTDDFYGR